MPEIKKPESEKPSFITVYESVSGWKAVMLWWNPDGFWEPWQTGLMPYGTEAEAEIEGRQWAMEERLEFRKREDGEGSSDRCGPATG